MKRLVLIDGNALVHRAFHALPPSLSSPKGVITNAVFGFTSVLFKMFKDLKPDYVVATFDLAGKTFRHEEFEDYKSHRTKAPDELYAQIPLIKEMVRALGIPVYEKEGFEADDVIGAVAEIAKKEKDLQVVIATGDLDTLQLVDKDKVVVFTLRKGITDTVIYDEKEVKKRYGLEPYQVTDFKGLKGDPSDNIPGVPGVGDKTASDLIQKYGSIENLYQELEKMTAKPKAEPASAKKSKGTSKAKPIAKPPISEKLMAKLLEFKDQAIFSKRLATIIRDVPLDFSIAASDWRKNLNKKEVDRLLREFGFFSLIKRLPEVYGETQEDQQNILDLGGQAGAGAEHLASGKAILAVLDKVSKVQALAFDIQEGIVTFTYDGEKAYYFDLGDITVAKAGAEPWQKFSEIFENEKIHKIGHDLKPQMKKFLEKEIDFGGCFFDTKLAAYLLNPDFRDYEFARIYFNEFSKDLGADMRLRPIEIWELQERLEKRIKANKLEYVFEKIEIPLMKTLAHMEIFGIKIDTRSLADLSSLVNKELAGLEKTIYKMAGIQFNINSPAQLSEILYTRLLIKGKIKKTGKGALSTAASELEKLVDEHPIISEIMRHRELQKLRTTYIEPFPHLLDVHGRVHTDYNQTVAATGRLSSQDPNLQNIPIKTDIGQEFRKCFISSPGYKLLSLDYSQLELRIVAHISGDEKMISAFKRGEDIHTRTAAEIFNVEPAAVTSNMRRQAKALNFGLIYGMGVLGFQRASGVDREKARQFIDRYMEEFSGVARYMANMKIKARKDGYVETIFGRKRFLPDINSGMPMLVSQAERIAVNMPVQGTNADLIKLAMNQIQHMINTRHSDGSVKMLLQIHDELVFEVKNDLVHTVAKEIKKLMEGVHTLAVPLTAEAKYGDNWRDMELI